MYKVSSSILAAIGFVGAFMSPALNPAVAEDAYPSKDIEWLVPYGPGSGGDILARKVIEIMDKYDLYPHRQMVSNVEGSSGSVGYTKLLQRAGDPYVISVTSSSFITAPLVAETAWKTTGFTPVALVGRDDFLLVVNKDSELNTLEKFVAAAKTRKLKIGTISLLSGGYLVGSQLSQAAGYEWDAVPFSENSQMFPALFSGSIDALFGNFADIAGQLEAGDMIALGVGSVERAEQFRDIPTFAESGYKTTAAVPRGIIMAPDAPKEAQAYWIEAIKKVVATPEWQEFLRKNGTSSTQLFGEELGAYYAELSKDFESALRAAGAIQ